MTRPITPHVPHEHPNIPGVCAHCPLPVDARNARHVASVTDLPAAPDDPQRWAAGERVDR